MNSKNYTDVLIGGKIYTLGGAEETGYLQQVAAYLNEKIDALEGQAGFLRQPEDYRHMVLCLNLADDYFHQKEQAEALQKKLEEQERELYALKHDLVTLRIEQERLVQEKEQLEQQLQKSTGTYHRK